MFEIKQGLIVRLKPARNGSLFEMIKDEGGWTFVKVNDRQICIVAETAQGLVSVMTLPHLLPVVWAPRPNFVPNSKFLSFDRFEILEGQS